MDHSDSDGQVVDYSTMTEQQLRDRYSELTDLIAELRGRELTVEVAATINDLRLERNAIVEAIRSIASERSRGDGIVDEDIDASTEPAEATAVEDTAVEETAVEDTTVEETAVEELVAVAASLPERPVEPSAAPRPRVGYVAAAGQSVYAQGTSLDMGALGRALESRKRLAPSPDGQPVQAVVASLPAFEETADLGVPILSSINPVSVNDRIIADAVDAWRTARSGAAAKTAAVCEPLDVIRDIPKVGMTDSPFADLFPQRPISRLGFTYTPASSPADTNAGIAAWEESNQAAVDDDDPSTWKPCVAVTCTTPVEVKATELTTCATVDSFVELSSPERVEEFLHLLGVQRARRREQHLLTRFDATASGYTFTGTYGVFPSIVQAVQTLLPQLLYVTRDNVEDYELVLEPGVVNKLVYDEWNKSFTDPMDVMAALTRATGLRVTALRDFKGASPFQTPPTPGGSSVTLAEVPDVSRVRLVPAGAYIYGATGEQSTGWQTDPQLARQNKRQLFTAEWVLLAKHGASSAAFIDVTAVGNGSRADATTAFGVSTYSGS